MLFDLVRYWYRPSLHPVCYLLLPLSWLFGFCVAVRRTLYQLGILSSQRFSVPVIVVGNITVGGTGKTPFVIWLATFLRQHGYRPGIVSRGVGGKSHLNARVVNKEDMPEEVGDEALLIRNKTDCPMVVSRDRAKAVSELLQKSDCNVVISDDGLQHYGLQRQIEIALIDGDRRLGNQQLLPAGPLREPVKRLREVDMVIVKEGKGDELSIAVEPVSFVSVGDRKVVGLDNFKYQKVHAIAGIGHPEKFFTMLQQLNIEIIPHIFSDHYFFQPKDLIFNDDLPILMTEKDAVKCRAFADERCWFLDIAVKVDDAIQERLLRLVGVTR